MSSINKCMLIGPCYDLVTSQTKAGKPMCFFNLIHTEFSGDKKKTNTLPCIAYSGIADTIAKYFENGKVFFIDGKIETYDQDNVKKFQIVISDFRFI